MTPPPDDADPNVRALGDINLEQGELDAAAGDGDGGRASAVGEFGVRRAEAWDLVVPAEYDVAERPLDLWALRALRRDRRRRGRRRPPRTATRSSTAAG